MRKIVISAAIISVLFSMGIDHISRAEEPLKGTITMSGAWALYPMAVKWGEEFQKIHPNVKLDIAAGGAGKGMADALAQVVDIGMVSREVHPAEIEKGAWWVSVTKDAVVPTMNAQNPYLSELLSKGVAQETLIGIWGTGETTTWGEVVGQEPKHDIHVYTRSDACGAAGVWAKFLENRLQEDLGGVGVYGDPGLAEAVRKDVLGIGYNNINFAYDAATKMPVQGITIVPIDINGNGRLDPEENFYATQDELVGAIANGSYPSPPARALHFVSQGRPAKKEVLEFMKWVLTEGQQYIPEAGYITLNPESLQDALQKIEKD